MGLWSGLLRRLGYARLRDYNLRATADGVLVPVSSQIPVPIDLSTAVSRASLPPPPPRLADGSQDNLRPVRRWPRDTQPMRPRSEPLYRGPPAPESPPLAFDDEDDTEIVEAPPWVEPPSRR